MESGFRQDIFVPAQLINETFKLYVFKFPGMYNANLLKYTLQIK
jgi:hypothetical protein